MRVTRLVEDIRALLEGRLKEAQIEAVLKRLKFKYWDREADGSYTITRRGRVFVVYPDQNDPWRQYAYRTYLKNDRANEQSGSIDDVSELEDVLTSVFDLDEVPFFGLRKKPWPNLGEARARQSDLLNPRRTPWVVVRDGRIVAGLSNPNSKRAKVANRSRDELVLSLARPLRIGDRVVNSAGEALPRD